jgi:hypothetical protein
MAAVGCSALVRPCRGLLELDAERIFVEAVVDAHAHIVIDLIHGDGSSSLRHLVERLPQSYCLLATARKPGNTEADRTAHRTNFLVSVLVLNVKGISACLYRMSD